MLRHWQTDTTDRITFVANAIGKTGGFMQVDDKVDADGRLLLRAVQVRAEIQRSAADRRRNSNTVCYYDTQSRSVGH